METRSRRPVINRVSKELGNMPEEINVAIVRRIFNQGINGRDDTVFDAVIAPDYVAHSAVLGEVRGVETFKQGFRAFIDPCPDFRASLDAVLAAGDKVTA